MPDQRRIYSELITKLRNAEDGELSDRLRSKARKIDLERATTSELYDFLVKTAHKPEKEINGFSRKLRYYKINN